MGHQVGDIGADEAGATIAFAVVCQLYGLVSEILASWGYDMGVHMLVTKSVHHGSHGGCFPWQIAIRPTSETIMHGSSDSAPRV